MKYVITTSSTCMTEYVVDAPDQETAEEFYKDGNFEDSRETDFLDEEVLSIEKQ
jgi:hypothetical protein